MKRENVEDLYRLSPTQEGLLFHSLAGGEAAPYFEQFVVHHGALDPALIERSLEQLFARHPILRTSFSWEKVEKPVQIVHRRVELPFRHEDWSGLATEERERRLPALLAQERARGFDLTRPPLLRLIHIRWDADSSRIVWNFHHLLIDGWSFALVSQEMRMLYEAALQSRQAALPQRRPFRDYIGWLRRQDQAAAEAYWRNALAGFASPTVLAADLAPGSPALEGSYAEEDLVVDEEATAALQALARTHRLTLYTLIEGALGFTLGRFAGTDDVVFGNTVSGRPASLPGADAMIGCFINTLPVRVTLPPEEELAAWLKRLQTEQTAQRQFEYSSLLDVRGWSGLPGNRPLFEAIMVFESSSAIIERSESWQGYQRTNFPLTMVVWPGKDLV
ncbi:MAG TPA: condensation domain-containing protein, partial [Thermoanaerobaculia bacterium]